MTLVNSFDPNFRFSLSTVSSETNTFIRLISQRRALYKHANMVKLEQNPGYSAGLHVVISRYRPVAKPAYYLTHNAGNFALFFGSNFSFHRSKFDQSLSVAKQKITANEKKSRLLQPCRRQIGITKQRPSSYLLIVLYVQNKSVFTFSLFTNFIDT